MECRGAHRTAVWEREIRRECQNAHYSPDGRHKPLPEIVFRAGIHTPGNNF